MSIGIVIAIILSLATAIGTSLWVIIQGLKNNQDQQDSSD